jgi:hypothetical protein
MHDSSSGLNSDNKAELADSFAEFDSDGSGSISVTVSVWQYVGLPTIRVCGI